jgi:hypothetical protein
MDTPEGFLQTNDADIVASLLTSLDIPRTGNVYLPDNTAIRYASEHLAIPLDNLLQSEKFYSILQYGVNPRGFKKGRDQENRETIDDLAVLEASMIGKVTYKIIDGVLAKPGDLDELQASHQPAARYMGELAKDNMYNIVIQTDVPSFRSLCQSNKRFASFCRDNRDALWRKFLERDFNILTYGRNIDPEQYYMEIENHLGTVYDFDFTKKPNEAVAYYSSLGRKESIVMVDPHGGKLKARLIFKILGNSPKYNKQNRRYDTNFRDYWVYAVFEGDPFLGQDLITLEVEEEAVFGEIPKHIDSLLGNKKDALLRDVIVQEESRTMILFRFNTNNRDRLIETKVGNTTTFYRDVEDIPREFLHYPHGTSVRDVQTYTIKLDVTSNVGNLSTAHVKEFKIYKSSEFPFYDNQKGTNTILNHSNDIVISTESPDNMNITTIQNNDYMQDFDLSQIDNHYTFHVKRGMLKNYGGLFYRQEALSNKPKKLLVGFTISRLTYGNGEIEYYENCSERMIDDFGNFYRNIGNSPGFEYFLRSLDAEARKRFDRLYQQTQWPFYVEDEDDDVDEATEALAMFKFFNSTIVNIQYHDDNNNIKVELVYGVFSLNLIENESDYYDSSRQ